MFSTNKTVYLLLAVLVMAYGVVGHMDYEDARMFADAEEQDAIRLECQSAPFPASSRQASAVRRFIVNGIDDIDEEAVQSILHCAAIDESGDRHAR